MMATRSKACAMRLALWAAAALMVGLILFCAFGCTPLNAMDIEQGDIVTTSRGGATTKSVGAFDGEQWTIHQDGTLSLVEVDNDGMNAVTEGPFNSAGFNVTDKLRAFLSNSTDWEAEASKIQFHEDGSLKQIDGFRAGSTASSVREATVLMAAEITKRIQALSGDEREARIKELEAWVEAGGMLADVAGSVLSRLAMPAP